MTINLKLEQERIIQAEIADARYPSS